MEDLVNAVAGERTKLRGWSQWSHGTRGRVGCFTREWRNEAVCDMGRERESESVKKREQERE